MSELTIKYINGLHESYDAKNIKEAQNGFSFDTFDENSNVRNHFFIPYSSIIFTNNKLVINNGN